MQNLKLGMLSKACLNQGFAAQHYQIYTQTQHKLKKGIFEKCHPSFRRVIPATKNAFIQLSLLLWNPSYSGHKSVFHVR